MGYSETQPTRKKDPMDTAQAAAFVLPFLFTLVVAASLLLLAVKITKTIAHVATAPVRQIRRTRRR